MSREQDAEATSFGVLSTSHIQNRGAFFGVIRDERYAVGAWMRRNGVSQISTQLNIKRRRSEQSALVISNP